MASAQTGRISKYFMQGFRQVRTFTIGTSWNPRLYSTPVSFRHEHFALINDARPFPIRSNGKRQISTFWELRADMSAFALLQVKQSTVRFARTQPLSPRFTHSVRAPAQSAPLRSIRLFFSCSWATIAMQLENRSGAGPVLMNIYF